MAGSRPFAHLTDSELKHLVERVVLEYEYSLDQRRDALLGDVAALREELIERLRGRGWDDPSGGVREPRRPLPGGSAAAAAVDPED